VGGTMSTRAAIRSKKVSSAESSEETEERDADDDVREESEEAYGEAATSFSSTISTLTMMGETVSSVTLCLGDLKFFGTESEEFGYVTRIVCLALLGCLTYL